MRAAPLCTLALAACAPAEPAAPPPSPLVLDARQRVTPLDCPGDASCPSASGPLWVGAAARAITPAIETWTDLDDDGQYRLGEPFEDLDGDGVWDPVWLAGFGLGRPAREVHDDTWARALVLRQGELRVGVVSLDTVGWFHDGAIGVRLAAVGRGLDLDHVVVASTHQHEGKDTMGLWGPSSLVRSIDEAYVARVETACVDALEAAMADEREATVTIARGSARELISDSRLPEVIDDVFTIVRFAAPGGAVHAIWTIWGNHPEALGGSNRALTSDYPHYLRARLEAEYPASTAVFSSGSLGGLMNPLGIVGCPDADGRPTCRAGTFELAEYVGSGLAERALAALRAPAVDALPAAPLAVRRLPFLLATGNAGFATAVALGVIDRRMFHADGEAWTRAELSQLTMVDALEGRALMQTEVNLLRLGPLEVLFVPGELYPELWLARPDGSSWVERPEGGDHPDAPIAAPLSSLLSPGALHAIVNQANDSLGYIIPKSQFDLAPPFTYGRTDPPYGEGVSNGPDTSAALTAAVKELTKP